MTEILSDNIEVDLQIGEYEDEAGEIQPIEWNLVQAKVKMTQAAIPNYVDMVVTPKPQFTEQIENIVNDTVSLGDNETFELPNEGIGQFVGEPFDLQVDTNFVAVESDSDEEDELTIVTRDEAPDDIEEDRRLFKGRLANISPIGNNLFEAIAYGPGQQAFNIGEESGSILNQKIIFGDSTRIVFPGDLADNEDEVEGDPPTDFSVNDLLNLIIEETDLGEVDGDEPVGNVSIEQFDRSDTLLGFDSAVVTVKEALNQAREITDSEWWFDKSGTFHFEDPTPFINNYELELIKDTTAGMQTPPYQSVQVIGSGIATSDGWNSTSLEQDDSQKIVKSANIARPEGQNPNVEGEDGEVEEGGEAGALAEKILVLDPDTLQTPTFKYVNAELNTDRQAQNATLRIANELIKQQASGKVTVVGLPEVEIFDGIRMPNSDDQPMGGKLYGVYAVTHKLNGQDGFVTEIEVAGPTPDQIRKFGYRAEGEDGELGEPLVIPTSTERDVYTPDGERRAFGPGAGEGDE